jgi:hypothetical protein
MIEDTEAYGHWQRYLRYSRGADATREGIEYLWSQIGRGRVFRPGEADPHGHLGNFAELGLADPLRRFWPRLTELVRGHEAMSARLASLADRTLIIEIPLDGFAAGTRPLADGSFLIQFDTGLFLTVFEVVLLFVLLSIPDPDASVEQTQLQATGLLELLMAEYRLLGENVSPKAPVPTPEQGDAIGELTQAANVFALTHEVSHILLGHTGDHGEQERDEVAADVLALRILVGAYATGAPIAKANLYGRLLGARLLFSCIELYENATFVRSGRTHPPATQRWRVVRSAANDLIGPSVLDGVDHLWQPFDGILAHSSSGTTPMSELASALTAMSERGNIIGGNDLSSSVRLIPLYRLTNIAITDSDVRAEGEALAAAAEAAFAGQESIAWRALLNLQTSRARSSFTEQIAITAVAARLLGFEAFHSGRGSS